jgi:hypothetical protein
MKERIIIFALVCFAIFSSCNKSNSNQLEEDAVLCMMEPTSNNFSPPPPPPPSEKGHYNPKLIKKGNMTISSTDIELTKKLVYQFLKRCNGYVVNENLEKSETESYYYIDLNIQARSFEKFIQLIDSAKLNVVSRSFSVEDVSLQYIDDSTRLANKKKLENRYLEILSKAKDIKEMLQIEEKLEQIRTDAEVREAQLKMIDKQVAYSSFTLKIEKSNNELSSAQKEKYSYEVTQGISKGWNGFKAGIVFLISIWPIYLLFAFIYFALKFILKRRKTKVLKT